MKKPEELLPESPQQTAESFADDLIWQHQDFEFAKQVLGSAANKALLENDLSTHHSLSLKEAALPLYQLALEDHGETLIEKAQATRNDLANLLENSLFNLQYGEFDDGETAVKALGRMSEIALQLLATQDLFNDDPRVVLLPSTSSDDQTGRSLKTDYYLSAIKGKGAGFYPIQLKNRLTPAKRAKYAPTINLIGLNTIDPKHYRQPGHPESLASVLLREVRGEGLGDDHERIKQATAQFYQQIHTSSEGGFVDHPTKPGWKQPANQYLK